MIVTIIAGGSGTRLWPLSQASYPKHLLKLTGKKSLLQNTYTRSKKFADTVYVVTESSHADEVARQLPKLGPNGIIIEPARRGTASCILLALNHIAAYHQPDEPIVFLHADSYIKDVDGFASTVDLAAQNSERHQAITLIGIHPTYPATGFGYIESGDKLATSDGVSAYKVEKFKEKPNLATASKYLKAGNYLWNMGLFAAPAKVFHQAFKDYAPTLEKNYQSLAVTTDAASLEAAYLELPSAPIDTALIEKTKNLEVVAGTFDWADIGSFFDLHKIIQGTDSNALEGDVELIECEDVMIHGSDKPVVAIGLSGVVVVDSPNGLLVCAKEKSQLVGEAAKRLQARKNS